MAVVVGMRVIPRSTLRDTGIIPEVINYQAYGRQIEVNHVSKREFLRTPNAFVGCISPLASWSCCRLLYRDRKSNGLACGQEDSWVKEIHPKLNSPEKEFCV